MKKEKRGLRMKNVNMKKLAKVVIPLLIALISIFGVTKYAVIC